MPVEIRELQIRVQVQGSVPAPDAPRPVNGAEDEDRRREWMAEWMDQVFDIIESKKER